MGAGQTFSAFHAPLGSNSPIGHVRGRMADTRALEGSQLTSHPTAMSHCAPGETAFRFALRGPGPGVGTVGREVGSRMG